MKSINIGTPAPTPQEIITASFDDINGHVLPAIGERVNLYDDDGHHVGTGRVTNINAPFKVIHILATPSRLTR